MKEFPVEVIYILVFIGIVLFQFLMKRFGPPPPQDPAQEEQPAPFPEEMDESPWAPPASRAAIEPIGRSEEPSAPVPVAGRRFTRRALMGSRREVQNAIVIAAILGPCRALERPARNP